MITGKAIFTALSGNQPLAEIVGNRIYPAQAPEPDAAYPKIVYEGDTEVDEQAYDGATGLITQTVAVACMALVYADASGLADAAKDALAAMAGPIASLNIQGAFLEDRNETTEADDDLGPNSTVHVHVLQFSIVFNKLS